MSVKSIYVGSMRNAGRLAKAVGVIGMLDRLGTKTRWVHWLRSLFAIYDIEALIALDVPWWTYDAIKVADNFLSANPGARVFEFGSGASTIWLARRAGSVISVEHDADWCKIVRSQLRRRSDLAPVTMRLVPPDPVPGGEALYRSEKSGARGAEFMAYASAINAEAEQFDLIVIDGRARQACLAHAESRLAPGGMIVFDNSRRSRYRQAISRSKFTRQAYRGLAPSLPYPDETTIMHHATGQRSDP